MFLSVDWTPNSANFSFLWLSAYPKAFHAFWYKWPKKLSEIKRNMFAMEVLFMWVTLWLPLCWSSCCWEFQDILCQYQRWKTDSWRARFRHTLHPQSETNSSPVNAFHFSIQNRTWNNSLATGMFQRGHIFCFFYLCTTEILPQTTGHFLMSWNNYFLLYLEVNS